MIGIKMNKLKVFTNQFCKGLNNVETS